MFNNNISNRDRGWDDPPCECNLAERLSFQQRIEENVDLFQVQDSAKKWHITGG